MDLVAHCGWSGAGEFLYTLSMVDVATGWVACAGLRDKRSDTVFHALQRIRAELPFCILGLDSDNGTEFINRALLAYCTDQHITFTRSRPYLKNDTCHVELCGYPHNSTYADSGIMPMSAKLAPRSTWGDGDAVGIIPALG